MKEQELRAAIENIDAYFRSGNSVPVTRATIKVEEWEAVKAASTPLLERIEELERKLKEAQRYGDKMRLQKTNLFIDTFSSFGHQDRGKLANLLAHDYQILAIELKDKYGGRFTRFDTALQHKEQTK
jgi:hypothetical protein